MWLNYGDLYAVSSDGEVKNRINDTYLMPCYDKNGYLYLNIRGKTTHVHRIVADRFCPKIDESRLQVDHINRDCTDNRASNLRWCDSSTNLRNRNSKNIYKHNNGCGYNVTFKNKGKYIHSSWHKTIEEATAARDAFRLSLQ